MKQHVFILLLFIISCDNDEESEPSIVGKWAQYIDATEFEPASISVSDFRSNDTLYFTDNYKTVEEKTYPFGTYELKKSELTITMFVGHWTIVNEVAIKKEELIVKKFISTTIPEEYRIPKADSSPITLYKIK